MGKFILISLAGPCISLAGLLVPLHADEWIRLDWMKVDAEKQADQLLLVVAAGRTNVSRWSSRSSCSSA